MNLIVQLEKNKGRFESFLIPKGLTSFRLCLRLLHGMVPNLKQFQRVKALKLRSSRRGQLRFETKYEFSMLGVK